MYKHHYNYFGHLTLVYSDQKMLKSSIISVVKYGHSVTECFVSTSEPYSQNLLVLKVREY